MYDIVIIGGGVSGFSGAMYAGRFGMKTLIFTGDFKGGLITWAKEVQNYPGFKNITGMELAKKIEEHARDYDIEVKGDMVTKIKRLKKGDFEVYVKNKKFLTTTILFATGTQVRVLGAKGEGQLKNKGVHYCALCDGPFYRGKIVAVIGGSDAAAIEALILSDIAKKVYIIYRKEKIRAEAANRERIEKKKNIEIINNTNVVEFVGQDKLEKVKLDKKYKGKDEMVLDAVFVSIGHIPRSDLAKEVGVKLDKNGFVMIDKNSKTNVEGFYAAGDVADREFKQAITGVAEAVTATYWAYHYVQDKRK